MEKLPPQLPYYSLMLAAFLTAFGAAVGAATGARPRWFFLHAAGLAQRRRVRTPGANQLT